MAATAKKQTSSRSSTGKSRSHGKSESRSESRSGKSSASSRGRGQSERAESRSKSSSRSKAHPGTIEMVCEPVRKGSAAARARSSSSSAAGKRATKGAKSSGSSSRGRGKVEGAGQTTTDHEQIRQWVEERGGKPACVRGTGGKGDTGMLRIDMPGYTGADKLQAIDWDDWFEKFEEKNLAFLYQDETKGGTKSNFNKLVSRDGAK